MGAAGDEGDVVAVRREPGAEIAADPAGSENRDLHAAAPGEIAPTRLHQARIRRTAPGRPTASASPTMKWPMLSSTTRAIAATGAHVGVGRARARHGIRARAPPHAPPPGAAARARRPAGARRGVAVGAGVQLDHGRAGRPGGVELRPAPGR